MALRKVSMSFADTLTYRPPHPDRTARRTPMGMWSNTTYQEWASREAMARSIRMQQKRAFKSDDWSPVIKLTDGEGYSP